MGVEGEPNIFKFRANGQSYVFHRDSFSVLRVPRWPLSDEDRVNVERILEQEKGKARDVGPLTLRTVALNVTNNCNFACDYCFANQGDFDNPGLVMSEATAINAVDLLFKNVSDNYQDRAAIAFFGGEPLLGWNLIKKTVSYAEVNCPEGIRLKFLITTNASLLDKEKTDFFKEHNFSVMVSLDGAREENDLHRKFKDGSGTYGSIVENIKRANESIPLTFRATITGDNLDLIKIVEHFRSLGASIITFGIDNDHLRKENYARVVVSYRELANYYLRDIMAGNFYEITNFTEVLLQIAFRERKVSHCNAGLSYLGVSAEGSLYKCPRFTGVEQHKFGDIKMADEVTERRNAFIEQLKVARERNIRCSECPFALLCGGLCHYDLFKKG